MGSEVGEDGGETSNTVSMEDLKNLETSLNSTLGNEIQQLHQLVEQLIRDKETSPPLSPEETPPNPKVNAPAKPLEEVVGDEHNSINSTTKKGDGKEEHHAVPGWYSPDPPIPHPHINNRGDPPMLAAHSFAQSQVLMKSHVRSSCIDLWNIIEQGLKIEDPAILTRREVVNSQFNATVYT